MKRTLNPVVACCVAVALAACHGAASAEDVKGQVARIDSKTVLSISMDGADATWIPTASSREGGPVDRVLQSADGKVLFAYGIEATKSDDGSYRLALKPAKTGPTFRTTRAVNVKPGQDAVRVELMAQRQTGQKIADVFQLRDVPVEDFHTTLFAPLMRAHNALYHWLHGE